MLWVIKHPRKLPMRKVSFVETFKNCNIDCHQLCVSLFSNFVIDSLQRAIDLEFRDLRNYFYQCPPQLAAIKIVGFRFECIHLEALISRCTDSLCVNLKPLWVQKEPCLLFKSSSPYSSAVSFVHDEIRTGTCAF